MEAQGLSEGSLRSSHRETHAVRRKPAPASFQDLARKVLESCSEDLIIRQRMDPQKAEGGMKRGTFFVLENEGRADPGFLVLMAGKPPIFMQLRRGREGKSYMQGNTLRMRVSTAVSEGGGSVLIATLDDVSHTLRLEDVWMWRGEALAATQTFSRRRERLKEFVERHWVPDARLLGGIYTTVAQPKSLEEFSARQGFDGLSSVEFIPEAPGRRRLVCYLEALVKAAKGHAGLKQERGGGTRPSAPAPTAVAPPSATEIVESSPSAVETPSVAIRKARAVAVDKMPDVYDLYGEDGFPISRASVQQFTLSQKLRAQQGEIWVLARWRAEFGGYEIMGLATAQA